MDEDLAVALAAGDGRWRHGEHAEAACRQIDRDGDDSSRASLRIAHDAAFADRITSRLKLRFHKGDEIARVAKLRQGGRQGETQRDERDVRNHEVDRLLDGHGVPRISALVHDDPRILPESPIKLSLPHVDRVNPERAPLQQHVGEAAGRRADVDGNLPGHVEAEGVERSRELVAAPRYVLRTGVDGEFGIQGDGRRRPVGSAAVDTHRAREDQGLCALAARGELALHQELIKPNSFCQRADSRAHSRYCAAMPGSYVRAAGIASVLSATFVLLGVAISGVVTPNYDATRDLISAAQLGPRGSLVTLGLTGGGSMTVVFASLLQRTLPPGGAIGPALLVVRGFGTLLAAAFFADLGPVRTLGGLLHVVGFTGGSLAFGIGLFFLAGRMHQDESWERLAPYTVATALASLAILGLFVGLGPRYVGDTSAPLSFAGGVIERFLTVTMWMWNIAIGGWLLMRPAPSPVES
jgi:uncharacterized protein DUF998